MTPEGTADGPDVAALRAAAEAVLPQWEPDWPRRDIAHDGTCDSCGETRALVAAYDDPSGENEPWLCVQCAPYTDYIIAANPTAILALLDRLAAVTEQRDQRQAALVEVEEAFIACFTPDFAGYDWRDDAAVQTFARRAGVTLYRALRADGGGE